MIYFVQTKELSTSELLEFQTHQVNVGRITILK